MIQEIVELVRARQRDGVAAVRALARQHVRGDRFSARCVNFWLADTGVPGIASPERLRDLLSGGRDAASAQALRHALEGALHATFLAMVAFAVLTGLVILLTPNVALGRRGEPAVAPAQAE